MAWRNAYGLAMLNPLAHPTYYTTLFETFKALLNEEHTEELNKQIKQVEEMLSDDFNKITLHEAELRMYQNMDLLSGFEVNGVLITQLEIQNKLEEIKKWLLSLLFAYMPYVRYTQPLKLQ